VGGFGLNSPPSIILIIALALAATGGGVTSLILIRRRRARTSAPGCPRLSRGRSEQVPGLDAARPSYHAHPGVRQPYNHQSGYSPSPQSGYGRSGCDPDGQPGHGQPGQQPRNPGRQH